MTFVDLEREVAGRYRLTAVLHRGRGVDTCLGTDLSADGEAARAVVLKLASVDVLAGSARRRLEHESAVLQRLSHPNVAPLLAYGEDGDVLYIVTSWIPGTSLAQRLDDGPLTSIEALDLGIQLTDALRHAHDHGVLHRDVKPANVIVDGDPLDRAVLVDFSLARSELLDDDVRDVPVGTVRYLAPEQAGLIAAPVDERSDLYALGLTLHEALTGRPVFAGHDVGQVLRQQMTLEVPRLGGGVPRILDRIVDRLLRRDPAERYQSAAALGFDLEELRAALDRGVADPAFTLGSHDRRETLAEPSFVGRARELAVLEDQVTDCEQGHGGLVLLGAESGQGKTWLLDELARRVGERVLLVRGQGLDQAAQRPFQVLTGVARGLIATGRGSDDGFFEHLRRAVGDEAEAAAVAFPELAPVLGVDRPASLGPEQFGEVRTVRALSAVLEALGTAERPALVLLDDCQWADELSGRLLDHWSSAVTAPCHVLVVVAFRTEEVGPESVLRRLRARERISLPAMTEQEVAALASSMAGDLPEAALEVTTRFADGSPFMASAVLRGLVEAGALVSTPTGWEVEESALEDVRSSRRAGALLARRIGLLREETRRLLGVGAVLGKEFEVDMAAVLAGVEPVTVARAVREANRRHLVWSRLGSQRCSFVHDKIRETLLDLFSDEERRRLHERTAVLLEEREPTRFFDLAFHFGAAGEAARALPYALVAGQQARAQHSLELAEAQYRIAEEGAGDAEPEVRRRIAEELGGVQMLRGRYEEAASQLERARRLAYDPVTLARIDGQLGELAFKRGDMAASSEALERGVRRLGQRSPGRGWMLYAAWEILVQIVHSVLPRRWIARRSLDGTGAEADLLAAHLYSRLAHTYWFQRGSLATLFVHLRGMNLAERYPPTPELAQAWSEHAPVMTLVPWYRRGIVYAERSYAIRRELDDLWGQGRSLHFYGIVLYAATQWEASIERCREAIRLLERTGDRWEVNTARWHVAYASYRLGDLATAARIGREVWRAGVELGDAQASGIGLAVWSKATSGRIPADATAGELASLTDDVHTAAELLSAEALRLLEDGDPAEAVSLLERADEVVTAAGLRQEYVAPVPCWLLTAMRAERDAAPGPVPLDVRRRGLRRARRLARRARRLAGRYRNNLPHALREAAMIEAEFGRARRARRLLDRSLDVAEQLGARQEAALTLLARGDVGQALGWVGAEEARRRGQELIDELEAGTGRSDRGTVTVSLLDRFDTVLSAGRTIASSLSVDVVFESLAAAAESLLRPQDCVVLATEGLDRRPPPDELVAVASVGVEASRSVIERAIEAGRPVVLHEAEADPGESMTLLGIRSVLCAPVLVRGEPVGCLYMTHRDLGGVFGDDETQIAEFLTALAGAALENAEGFAEVEALSRTLEERVDERTVELQLANEQLDERLAELSAAYDREHAITEQLRRLDQFKTDLVAMTAHDLRTPMTIIIGLADTLRSFWDDLEPEERRSLLDRMVANTRRLAEFVENLLQFARIESGEVGIQWDTLDLERLVRRTVEEFESHDPGRPFDLAFSDLPAVRGEEERQWQVLMNLLSNAVKHSPPDTPITVSAVPVGDFVEVSVSDRGPGIPESEIPKLFEKFSQIDDAESPKGVQGTGLGLYICRSLVEAHGGEIRVESVVGEGTTFTYTVPVAPDAAGEASAPSPMHGDD